jgi:hypothetical protein
MQRAKRAGARAAKALAVSMLVFTALDVRAHGGLRGEVHKAAAKSAADR